MGVRATLRELFYTGMIASQGSTGLPVGQLAVSGASGAPATGSANITMAANLPSWVIAGMPVYDVTAGVLLGKVSSTSSATLTLAANSAANGALGDVLQFGLTPSDISVGTAAGADVRGLVELCDLKITEAIAIINYLTSDVITAGQDATSNTVLTTAVTNLS